jgi:hypothetical protein
MSLMAKLIEYLTGRSRMRGYIEGWDEAMRWAAECQEKGLQIRLMIEEE